MSPPSNRRSPTARLGARSTRRSRPTDPDTPRPARRAPRRRWLALLALLGGFFAFGPLSASASAAISFYNEPAYTKTLNNDAFWYRWTAVTGSDENGNTRYDWYLCFRTYHRAPNGSLIEEESSSGTNGPGTQNCTTSLRSGPSPTAADYAAMPFNGTATTLQDGHYYELCASGFYRWPYLWKWDGSSACPGTTIDRNAPQASVALAGGAQYLRNAAVPVRIAYADATSPPWSAPGGLASNWVCVGSSACTPGGNPNNDCSVPADPNALATTFDCTATVPSDGRWYVCARTADRAVPDNAVGADQFASATSNNANLSGVACDDVVVDRAPPSVAVTADRTSITAGETVSFSASVSDATSGAPAPYTWDFGDGIGQSTGATPTHAYAQPGTYTVRFTARDVAGNESSTTTTITVAAAPGSGGGSGTGGGSGSGGSAGGGSTGGGSTGGGSSGGSGGAGGSSAGATGSGAATVTTAPAEKAVSSANGGGGTASVRAGTLRLVVPKRFTLTTKRRTLQLRATLGGPGRVELRLLRGKRSVARGTVRASAARTVGLGLKVPSATRAGTYTLRVVFRPAKGKAVTRTARIAIRRAAAPRAAPLVGRPADR